MDSTAIMPINPAAVEDAVIEIALEVVLTHPYFTSGSEAETHSEEDLTEVRRSKEDVVLRD